MSVPGHHGTGRCEFVVTPPWNMYREAGRPGMSTPKSPLHAATHDAAEAIAAPRAIAIGIAVAAILALAVSAQTYLSMRGHGHEFHRILAWQFGSWSCWAIAAPFVLRRGARFAAGSQRTWRDGAGVAALGALLLAIHGVIASQLTIWMQPLMPVV